MSNPKWELFLKFCGLFRIYELYFSLKAKSEIQILKQLDCIVLQTLDSWVSNWNVALHCCRPVFLLGKHDLCGAYHIVYVHKYQLGCGVSVFGVKSEISKVFFDKIIAFSLFLSFQFPEEFQPFPKNSLEIQLKIYLMFTAALLLGYYLAWWIQKRHNNIALVIRWAKWKRFSTIG